MSRRKRPWGVIAGPIIFFGGLVVFLGVQKAEGIKDMVQDWGYQLEHSSQPVVMELPVYVPLFVGGDWLGQLETVVVHRDRPGGVDSLRQNHPYRRRKQARYRALVLDTAVEIAACRKAIHQRHTRTAQ